MANNIENKKEKFKELEAAQLAHFFEQLAMFSKNGIPTWESLYIISSNVENSSDKELFTRLYEYVADGDFFSEALQKCNCFPNYVIGMIEVAEQTGRVEEVSSSLASYYRGKDRLSQSLRAAAFYPMVMASMVFVVIFVILVEVMPVFEGVFTQMGLALNPVSTLLLNIGSALNQYSAIALSLIVVVVGIYFLMRITTGGKAKLKEWYDTFFLTKNLSESENANRFAFSLSLMLLSGVDLINALEFSKMIVDSKKMHKKINLIISEVEKGGSLAEAIINSGIFKPTYNGMISAGMRSGSESQMLMAVSQRYSEETEYNVQKLVGVIEPSLVAFLCIMVGAVMLSVMLPITGILTGM